MGVSWQLVVGAALHWASMLYQSVEFSPSLLAPIEVSCVITPLSALVAILFSVFSHLLEDGRVRLAISCLCVAAGMAGLALTFVAQGAGTALQGPVLVAFELIATVNIVVPIILWGYAFASLDKGAAGHNAVYTALLAFVFALAIALVSYYAPGMNERLNVAARCASGVILAVGNVYFSQSEQVRRPRVSQALFLARFYGGRFLMGAAVGTLLVAVPGEGFSPLLMLVEIVFCLGLLCFLNTRRRSLVCEDVPAMPVVLAVLVWFPFLGSGSEVFGLTVPLVIWLSWLFVSSFQLSGLRESLAAAGALLSTTEKAALLCGWTAGLYVGKGLVPASCLDALSFVAVSAALEWAVLSSLHTVYSRREDDFADRANRRRAELEARVLGELRGRFGLTDREAQIAFLLSQGYTRPGVCGQVGISDGTARAHSSHIYAKLGIHKRDELIAAVQELEKRLEA